jgi:4-amino-4-deoxy-L-arabinose transferase-like glycosyltransferase
MSETRAFDWRVYRAVAIGFLAVKLALLVLARPFVDETYYWLWGQHLAISYFDHPPLIGWIQRVSATVLGSNIFGLRAAVLLTNVGDIALLYALARHLGGAAGRDSFWPALALFASTPIFFALTTLALPDHLLIFSGFLALYAFARFRATWDAGIPRWRFFYIAAFAVGLAILSKYSGALLAVALAGYLAFVPSLRGVFRTPHFYLAFPLVLVMQAPVLLWNIENDWASLGFILGGRRAFDEGFTLTGTLGYILGFPLVLSPFLLWPIARFLVARDDGVGFARLTFWLSSLAFLVASLFTDILVHWNILAYVAVLPLLAPWLRSRVVVIGHFIYGSVLVILLGINYTLMPMVSTFTYTDQTTSLSYGWEKVIPEIERIRASEDIGFIATPYYMSASALAFAMQDSDVVSLSTGRDAFDDWFDPAAHAGQNAIIVADRKRGLRDGIKAQFASVERVKRIDITINGYVIERYSIYIARKYAPSIQ